jgi:hypothetical protein
MANPRSYLFQVQGWPLALALFLATIYPSSEIFWLPAIALWAAQQPKLLLYRRDLFLLLFISGVIVQTLYGLLLYYEKGRAWSPDPLAYAMLLLCALMGRSFSSATIRWLIAFFCLEAAICCAQMLLRRPYVFDGQREMILNAGVTQWGSNDLLYFNRVYGLSTNSSVAAQKFMLGILLLFDKAAGVRRWRTTALVLFSVGLYATFNRTTLFAVFVFLGIKAVAVVFRASRRRQVQVLCIAALAAAATALNWRRIETQFLRGNIDSSLVEDSGRSSLWHAARDAMAAHPIVGNLSQRFMVFEDGEWFHLHSSWLQLVVDHGLVGWFLITHSLSLITRRNFASFCAIGLYSLVQFGLFGKISLINIVFYYLMRRENAPTLSPSKSFKSKQATSERPVTA